MLAMWSRGLLCLLQSCRPMGLSARALLEKLHSQDYGTSDIYISGMMMIDDKALFK